METRKLYATYVPLLYTYHITTTVKNARALDTLLRSGDRLMVTFTALQTVSCLIRTVVMRRTSYAEHFPNPETRRTRDVRFDFHPTVVRFDTCVNRQHL